MSTSSLIPLRAAAIAFPRYHPNINSTELAERLIRPKSVPLVPADHFGLDHHLWINLGLPPTPSRRGRIIHELATELQG